MKEYASRKDMLKDLVPAGSSIAEIGVFAGDFSDWMIKALKPKKLYAVDPYISTIGVMGSGNVDGYGMEFYDLEILSSFVQNRFYEHPEVEICREFSGKFFERNPDGFLDAVYIDGDHDHAAVMADLENARYAVKEDGWIFGHDYGVNTEKGNPEVKLLCKDVVAAFCAKYNLEVFAVANDGIQSFAIRNTKKYTFCIVSVSNRPELYTRTFPSLTEYAHKHSYDIFLHTQLLCNDRHPTWSKIPAVSMELEKDSYDFIVWMDDDIFITNPDISLASFIDKYGFRRKEAVIMISGDIPNEPSTHMNAGMFFVKGKNKKTPALLSTAWQFASHNPVFQKSAGHEQEAFNFIYRYMERDIFHIIPLPNFQTMARFQQDLSISWKPHNFCIHFNMGPTDKKIQMLKLIEKQLRIEKDFANESS